MENKMPKVYKNKTEEIVAALRGISKAISSSDDMEFPAGGDKELVIVCDTIANGGHVSALRLAHMIHYIADMMEE
jgi:hypothetical protein